MPVPPTTTRMAKAALLLAALCVGVIGIARAQTFSAAPVVFTPTGSNAGQSQNVSITLNAPSTIRSISIPLGFDGNPEFFLIDRGDCTEDGTTVNAAGTVCHLIVRFYPAAAGLRTANILITDGSGNATAIGLSGIGYYPQASINPGTAPIIAGQGPSYAGYTGDGGAAVSARLNLPQGITADSFGNVYVVDNNVVRMLDAFGNITTVAGGGSAVGAAANGGQATLAKFTLISHLACDSAGNLYISDSANNVVWRVAMSTTHILTAVAGNFTQGFSGDGGTATSAQLHTPLGIALDPAGQLYIADEQNQRIRLVDASGTITTFAGSGNFGTDLTPVSAANAHFAFPFGLALDLAGNLYISEPSGHYVRRLSAGTIAPFAGTGASGDTGDGVAATSATLNYPAGLAISAGGDVFISDGAAGVVRKVQASDGVIETVVGDPSLAGGFTATAVSATALAMNSPVGLAFNSQMNLYIVDSGNSVVRRLSPATGGIAFPFTVAGSTSAPYALEISNLGNAPLSLVNVAAANSVTASNFTLTSTAASPCGSSVAVGTHCQYSVAFAPQSTGNISGEIDVTNVADNPNFNTTDPVYLFGGALSPISISPSTLSDALSGQAYSATLAITGGYGNLHAEVSGSIPPGLTANANASSVVLSGTPTTAGNYSFTVMVDDALGNTAQQSFTLLVRPAVVALTLTESVHIMDAPVATPAFILAVTESIHVADMPVQMRSLLLAVTESVHITDTPTQTRSLLLSVAEAIHVKDAPIETPGLFLAVTESIHITDSNSSLESLTLAVSEAVHIADAPLAYPSLTLALTEAVHVSDTSATTLGLALRVSEAIKVSDGAQEAAAVPLALSPGSSALAAGTVNAAYPGTTISATGGVGTITLTPTGSVPGLTLTASGSAVTLSGSPTTAGSFTFTIAATDGLNDSASGTYSVVVSKQNQTLTVAVIPSHVYGDAVFTPQSSASSGLPVALSVVSGPATATSNSVDLTGAGTVVLSFSQSGDANTSAATSVQRSFTVSPAAAVITADNTSRAFETANPSFTFTTTGLVHGDTVGSFSGTPSLTATAVLNSPSGTYPITAKQGTLASPNYTLSFANGTLTIVGYTAQTITFNKIPTVPLAVGTLTLTAHSTSSLPITYTVTGPAILSSGDKLTLTGAGTVTVTASQAGNATFDSATPLSRSFTVTP